MIFSFFPFCECVCVCFFVWFCLYSFAFTICPRVLSVRFLFVWVYFLALVVIGRFVFWFGCSLLSLFLFLNYFLIFFMFNNYFFFFLLITLFYFIYFFLSFFFSPFSSERCGWQGLGAPAGCQASASEVGEPSSGHWSTRDLPAPRNIKHQKLSQRSPSQY